MGELGAEVGGGAREDAGQGAAEGFCIAGLVAVGGIWGTREQKRDEEVACFGEDKNDLPLL